MAHPDKTDLDALEWPREIWMAEREDHDQGVVSAVLSEQATVARFAGDVERDRDFHRYVDGDIYDSADRYHETMTANLRAANMSLTATVARLSDERAELALRLLAQEGQAAEREDAAFDAGNAAWLGAIGIVAERRNTFAPGRDFKLLNELMGEIDDARRLSGMRGMDDA